MSPPDAELVKRLKTKVSELTRSRMRTILARKGGDGSQSSSRPLSTGSGAGA